LTSEELERIKDYVIEKLPRVLEDDPRFAVVIEGMLSVKFAKRDEFARLLDELTAVRLRQEEAANEMRSSFGRVDQRFELVIEETRDSRKEVSSNMQELREDTVRNMQELREDTVRNMQELREDTVREMREQGEALCEQMRDLRDWVHLIGGRLQTRVGKSIEDVVAGALRLGLSRSDIKPESVKLRQKFIDSEGLFFKAGKEKEVDLVAQDGELLVFEVKTSPKWDDVDDFADKVKLVRLHNPQKVVTGILVSLGMDPDLRPECKKRGIVLIP
jgi:hypothetical protein